MIPFMDNLLDSKPAQIFVGLLVFLALLSAVTINSGFATAALPLVLLGLFCVPFLRIAKPLDRNEKLLFFILGFYALVNLGSFVFTGDGLRTRELALTWYYLLAMPAYLLLRRVNFERGWFWWGLAAGAIGACIVGAYDFFVLNHHRVEGGTNNPILYGDLSLALGCMSLAGYGYFRRQHRWLVLIPLLACLGGLTASVWSGTRGAWIALPALAVLFAFSAKRFSRRLKSGILLIGVAAFAALALTPGNPVHSRMQSTTNEAQLYFSGNGQVTSTNARFHMWDAAWSLFMQEPLTGVGISRYQQSVKDRIAAGETPASLGQFQHAHNQYLTHMAELGLVGLFALLLLYLVPLNFFWRLWRSGTNRQQSLALAGLILVVGYMHFALTEAIMGRNLPTLFYIFVLIFIWQLLTRSPGSRSAKQLDNLSVIIICKNEEDRIDACLRSVSSWVNEIIVLDSGSEDNTVAIAKRYTDNVVETDWPGYGQQKQRALEAASGPWILSLDTDEVVTAALQEEIIRVIALDDGQSAYRIPRASFFGDKRLDFDTAGGGAPPRLFRKQHGTFSTALVHETVNFPANIQVSKLHNQLLHYSYRSSRETLEKFRTYARLWAEDSLRKGKKASVFSAPMHGIFAFFKSYFLKLGILDGRMGFVMSALYAQYTFNKYLRLWFALRQNAEQRTG